MPFSEEFSPSTIAAALQRAAQADARDVQRAIRSGAPSVDEAAILLSPASDALLESLADAAHRATVTRFGKTICLFAPLYLSNECVCTCTYCGFSMGLDIRRRTLLPSEVASEARTLADRGIRSVLLVSSEHPKRVPAGYVADCIDSAKRYSPYVGLEIAAAEEDDYRAFVEAGCDGVVLYQETYDRDVYARHHLGGPKMRYAWRMDALERASLLLLVGGSLFEVTDGVAASGHDFLDQMVGGIHRAAWIVDETCLLLVPQLGVARPLRGRSREGSPTPWR